MYREMYKFFQECLFIFSENGYLARKVFKFVLVYLLVFGSNSIWAYSINDIYYTKEFTYGCLVAMMSMTVFIINVMKQIYFLKMQ